MKYKVGDRVRVREWDDMAREFGLSFTEKYINTPICRFNNDMRILCGKTVTIKRVHHDFNTYAIEEDNNIWSWTNEMFESLENTKNHWKEVAGWYELELNEEFDIEGSDFNPYRFTEKGLVGCDGDIETAYCQDIINGDLVVGKTYWKPKRGDAYYYISTMGTVISNINDFTALDLAFIKNGWCFKTRREAERNKERVLGEMKELEE